VARADLCCIQRRALMEVLIKRARLGIRSTRSSAQPLWVISRKRMVCRSMTGAAEWRYRRFILHHAKLAEIAGGVDAFIIGSELRGVTTARDSATTFPAVEALRSLASDVRDLLGVGATITYAADWSEYSGHRPDDGSDDVFFHLDPLWADENIDVVGVDWYPPLTDWRAGDAHADADSRLTSMIRRICVPHRSGRGL
jgi:hypothetical protein